MLLSDHKTIDMPEPSNQAHSETISQTNCTIPQLEKQDYSKQNSTPKFKTLSSLKSNFTIKSVKNQIPNTF